MNLGTKEGRKGESFIAEVYMIRSVDGAKLRLDGQPHFWHFTTFQCFALQIKQ